MENVMEKVEVVVEERVEGNKKNKYLSIEQAAAYVDRTTKTIRNWIKAGMPHYLSRNKYYIDIDVLEQWKNGKPKELELENMVEIIIENKVEKVETEVESTVEIETPETSKENFYEPEIVPPVERQPIPIIDVGRNFLTEVDEKILSNNERLIKQFQDMLNLQTENTAVALDKQREYFEGIIARAEEKNTQLINENKNLVMELQSKQDKLEANLLARVKETEEKIEAWREEQKEKHNISWWQKLFGKK